MKEHGERAAFVAAERADELFGKDDFRGAAVFNQTGCLRSVLQAFRNFPAVFAELLHYRLVKPNVHLGGAVLSARVVQLCC